MPTLREPTALLPAPGDLTLGRTTRLANRAQRRALRALYATCAIPGCTTYNRSKLHHVTWRRHGGRTDLDKFTHSQYAPLTTLCSLRDYERSVRPDWPHTSPVIGRVE